MNGFGILVTVTLIVLCCGQTREEKIDSLWENYNNGPGVAFSIIQNGKQVYNKQFGFSNLRSKTKIGKETKFLIGSVSKQFCALAIALLEEKGLLDVSQPISRYLPELKSLGNTTVLSLIQHTSGYRDFMNMLLLMGESKYFQVSREEAYELIKRQDSLSFVPGTKWDYSNTGYLICEILIEKISGMKYEEYLKQYIFDPLGMKDTVVSSDRTRMIDNAAYGYISPNNAEAHLVCDCIAGAGGIQTTHDDFFKFDLNFYNNKLGNTGNELIRKLTTPGKFNNGVAHNYAWGLMVDRQNGVDIVSHSGAFPGYLTMMIRLPGLASTFFMTSNVYDNSVLTKANQAVGIWMNGLVGDLKLNVHDQVEFPIKLGRFVGKEVNGNNARYVGWYHSTEMKKSLHITLIDGVLHTSIKPMGKIPFVAQPTAHHFWVGQQGGPTAKFIESNGNIVGIELVDFPRANNLKFRRLAQEPMC